MITTLNNLPRIKEAIMHGNCSSSQPPPSQCQSMANQFNHHFANVATGLTSDSPELRDTATDTNTIRVKKKLKIVPCK